VEDELTEFERECEEGRKSRGMLLDICKAIMVDKEGEEGKWSGPATGNKTEVR